PDALAFQAIARNRISFCVNGEREQPELAPVVITGDATNDDAILMHAQADSLDPLAIDTWCRLSVAKEFGKVHHAVLAEGCIQPAAVAGDTQQQRTLLVGQQHQHAAVGEQGASAGKVVPVELDYSRAVLAVIRVRFAVLVEGKHPDRGRAES